MPRNRKKKAVPDDFISFEDIDFDVDFLFDEIPNDEDIPTCGEQSNDDTIGQTEVEDEIETTTSTYYNTNQQAEQTLPKDMSSLTQRTVHKCDHCKKKDIRHFLGGSDTKPKSIQMQTFMIMNSMILLLQ